MYILPGKIEPSSIIGGCIAEFKNVWSIEKINKYINDLEFLSNDKESEIKFEPAKVLDNSIGLRNNYNMGLTNNAQKNSTMREINNDFYTTVNSGLLWYKEYFNITNNIHFVEGFNVLRYEDGENYGAHYDGGTETGRAISPILYLNDEYVGGELEFVNFNIKIKPTAGSLYLFPSNYAYRHIAHPIKSGRKYAIVTWLHDRPYDHTQRPFDQSQNLEHDHTGHNHN